MSPTRGPTAGPFVSRLSDSIRPWVEERLTPHPLRSFDAPVQLRSSAAAAVKRAFIRMSPQSALYERLINRAREAGWCCRELEGGHYAMFAEPQAVATALTELPA
jgi:hypothetical protein